LLETKVIRPAAARDADAIWHILESMIRADEAYPLPRDLTRADALAYWFGDGHEEFVAEDDDDQIVGTYYLRANQQGGGAHVANCGYVTAAAARGRGVGPQCAGTRWLARRREDSARCSSTSSSA
jgi:RimJ/RimL family protein N-acetyltransferase